MNAATLVDPSEIREHMEQRYTQIGKQVAIGKFEDYLSKFRSEQAFPYASRTTFPMTSAFGPNLLALADGTRIEACDPNDSSTWLSFAAIAPPGQRLRIQVVPSVAGSDGSQYGLTELSNWSRSIQNGEFYISSLLAVTPGALSDASGMFFFPVETTLRLDIFQGGRELKTTKKIVFTPRSPK